MLILWLLLAILATVFVQLLVANLLHPEKKVERLLKPDYGLDSPQFRQEVPSLIGAPILPGNSIELLNNGKEIFPAMLEAIDNAKVSITMETFIYWSGDVGDRFAEALCRKAKEGVEVKLLIDWVGSKVLGRKEAKKLKDSGVSFEVYRPLQWRHLWRFNHRTHRKILVVDGVLGFTGGVGIADEWKGDVQGKDKDHQWRDTHFRLRGPVVAEMQAVFANNWVKATGLLLHGPKFFPKLRAEGNCELQCFHSSPTEGSESIRVMFLYLIETASRSLDISASYFVPDSMLRSALKRAVARGVRVRVILPFLNNDTMPVAHASRYRWGDLLEGGVQIHRFDPTMYHAKAIIADGKIASIGSANFDSRSCRLNDEMNINIYDPGFLRVLEQSFEKDLERSTRETLENWGKRTPRERLIDRFCSLFETQM